jgi:hypothetical protein
MLFEVLTLLALKSMVSWDMTLCSSGTCCLHFQGERQSFTLQVEAVDVSEMADLYKAVWHHVPADKSVPLTVSSNNASVL